MTDVPDRPGDEREGAFARLASAARRGKAHYATRAAELMRWLRTPVSEDETMAEETPTASTAGPGPLRRVFAARHLQQRQRAHRGSGGTEASVAVEALERASRLRERED